MISNGSYFYLSFTPLTNLRFTFSETPLEQLPILEIDGKVLYQSNAIARFLGRKFNLLGSDEFETFEVDATLETIGDLRQGK